MVLCGFLLLVSLLLSAILAEIFKYVAGLIPAPGILLHALELVVSLVVITVCNDLQSSA